MIKKYILSKILSKRGNLLIKKVILFNSYASKSVGKKSDLKLKIYICEIYCKQESLVLDSATFFFNFLAKMSSLLHFIGVNTVIYFF